MEYTFLYPTLYARTHLGIEARISSGRNAYRSTEPDINSSNDTYPSSSQFAHFIYIMVQCSLWKNKDNEQKGLQVLQR